MTIRLFVYVLISVLYAGRAIADVPPQDNRWWWDDAWWNDSQLEVPDNYPVTTTWTSYQSGDVDVPALVARPEGEGKYPAVLFQHGRRGLDDWIQRHVRRLAARGFVVLAPDIYGAHFIGTHPIEHDYELEKDVDAAVDVLLAREDISEAIDRFGTHILEQAMRRSNWSQTKAAELLGLQRTYLSRLIKQKNIQQGTEES